MFNQQEHECDLFLMSGRQQYRGRNILASFARKGKRNVHGWGIIGYKKGMAKVKRSEKPALDQSSPFAMSNEFADTIEKIKGDVLMGHLRLASRGNIMIENNHPFTLFFLDHGWSMIHNGTGRNMDDLVPEEERILIESDNDSARVFEFLRYRIVKYYSSSSKRSIIEACRHAFSELLQYDDGSFNIILTNGYLSFVLIHWRPFYLLKREKSTGDVVILSTLKLSDDEKWIKFDVSEDKKARMLVFCGEMLVYNCGIE